MMKKLGLLFYGVFVFSHSYSQDLYSGSGIGVAETKREACDYALALARKEALETAGVLVKSKVEIRESSNNGKVKSSALSEVEQKAIGLSKLIRKNIKTEYNEESGLIKCIAEGDFEIEEKSRDYINDNVDKNIKFVEYDKNILHLKNQTYQTIKSIKLGKHIIKAEMLSNGNILVAYNEADNVGKIQLLDKQGESKYSNQIQPKDCIYNESGRIFEKFVIRDFIAISENKIIAYYVNSPWFPSVAVEYNSKLKKIGDFWSPGHITSVHHKIINGISYLFIAGLNNNMAHLVDTKYYISYLAFFEIDSDSISGQAAPVFGFLKPFGKGNYEWVRYFKPADEKSKISNIKLQKKNREKLFEVTFTDGRFYYFNFDGEQTGKATGDNYRRKYGTSSFGDAITIEKEIY